MADMPKKTNHRNKPKKSCFLGCFGFCGKEEFSEKEEFSQKISVKDNTSNITKKESSPGWFCWSRFRRNSFRTVPIDSTENDFYPTSSETEVHSSKSKFKCKSKCKELYRLFIKRRHPSPKTTPFQEIPTVVKASSDQGPEPEPEPAPAVAALAGEPATKEKLPVAETRHVPEQNVDVENRRSFERGESSKDEIHEKRLTFHRKIESIRTGSSQPVSAVSPENKPKPRRTAPKFSHSASFPNPKREKRAYPSSETRVTSRKSRKRDNAKVNELDPLVGSSILMVTLVIMLMCGRVCAILCTSAWLYVVPRLRAADNNDRPITKNNDEPDINSEEYKKKVVFEGFLERDRRGGL